MASLAKEAAGAAAGGKSAAGSGSGSDDGGSGGGGGGDDLKSAKRLLEQDGYVVIDVLNEKQVDAFWDAAWNAMESAEHYDGSGSMGIKRDDPKTWTSKSGWPIGGPRGMLQCGGWGQVPVCWMGREACRDAFAEVLGCQDLVTSFDGWCFRRPTQKNKKKPWFHIDQKESEGNEFSSFQGMLCLNTVGEDDACFGVIPESHKHYEAVRQICDKGWTYSDEQLAEIKEKLNLKPKRIPLKAGQLVLWDSRTSHSGMAAKKQPKVNPANLREGWRFMIYVSMLPKRGMDEASKKRRRATFEEKRTSKHHPYLALPFPRKFRYSRGQPPESTLISYETMTPGQRALLGWEQD